MTTATKPAASPKKPEAPEVPPPEGTPKPVTGSAADAALKKDAPPVEAAAEEEKPEVPKEVPYTEVMTHQVPAPNPAYKAPAEPPPGSKRLKDEIAAGQKTAEAIKGNQAAEKKPADNKEQPKPGGAPAAPPPPKK